jgi:N-methylhydantoinase B/oxoprolinase/acetone carboxylase alpha subunit
MRYTPSGYNTPMINPIQLEIYKHRFRAIAEEMGTTLCRTAYSSNIKERKDFSCAIFDAQGQAVAQAEHLPVHLGSMPLSVQAALKAVTFEPGDSVILNDPFAGGTHLPDITVIDPVFLPGHEGPALYVANRAHHADVGGMTPGSMPLSTDIFQEGLRIPALKWRKGGQIQHDLLQLILSNVRTPVEREGDLLAQWAANQSALRRLTALWAGHGPDLLTYAVALQDYAETMMREAIQAIPDGQYHFTDYLEDDGIVPGALPLVVTLTIAGDQATVDFTGTAAQTSGCVNTILAVTLSAVLYAFRCLLDASVPANAGCLRPITVIAPEGTLVNARFPSAVVGGNVETSQRLVDVLFGALAQALPAQIPAASQGTMNNLTIGGTNSHGQAYTYYETTGGGMGARPDRNGIDGIHTHMTNTLNTPIEALELTFPFRVQAYRFRSHSGGAGQFRGGDGISRYIQLLTPARVTLLSERRTLAPWGLQGGEPGQPGHNRWVGPDGNVHPLPSKVSLDLPAGAILEMDTPGGGGWGTALTGFKPSTSDQKIDAV